MNEQIKNLSNYKFEIAKDENLKSIINKLSKIDTCSNNDITNLASIKFGESTFYIISLEISRNKLWCYCEKFEKAPMDKNKSETINASSVLIELAKLSPIELLEINKIENILAEVAITKFYDEIIELLHISNTKKIIDVSFLKNIKYINVESLSKINTSTALYIQDSALSIASHIKFYQIKHTQFNNTEQLEIIKRLFFYLANIEKESTEYYYAISCWANAFKNLFSTKDEILDAVNNFIEIIELNQLNMPFVIRAGLNIIEDNTIYPYLQSMNKHINKNLL